MRQHQGLRVQTCTLGRALNAGCCCHRAGRVPDDLGVGSPRGPASCCWGLRPEALFLQGSVRALSGCGEGNQLKGPGVSPFLLHPGSQRLNPLSSGVLSLPRGTREEPHGGSGDTFCGRDRGKIKGPCSAWAGAVSQHTRAAVGFLSLPEWPRCPRRQPPPARQVVYGPRAGLG